MQGSRTPVTAKNPVYITKYALTEGILLYKAGEIIDGKYFKCGHLWVTAPYWHMDINAAVNRSREMAKKKLASVERQAKRLAQLAKEGAPVIAREGVDA